jgi:hypothetical protein
MATNREFMSSGGTAAGSVHQLTAASNNDRVASLSSVIASGFKHEPNTASRGG